MRAVRFHEHGGPEILTVDDVERPTPGEGELLVEVEAAGVNPVDTYFRDGAYGPAALPWTPGSDCAGTVAAVGDDTEHAVGDRVFATGLGNWLQGTCAEYAVVPESHAARLPDNVGFDAGAAVALVGVTAFQTLVAACSLEPGERALVHGGSGGVGHVAVQIAKTMGARVHATASPAHADELEALGADEVFNYAHDDLDDVVINAGGADAIVDLHMDQYLQFNADVANVGARVVGIGNDTAEGGFTDIGVTKGKEIQYRFMSMYNADDIGAVLARLAELCVREEVTPVIHETYDLEETAEAQRAVLEDSFVGKLVVRP
jgi:NADPH2:quinone reductase